MPACDGHTKRNPPTHDTTHNRTGIMVHAMAHRGHWRCVSPHRTQGAISGAYQWHYVVQGVYEPLNALATMHVGWARIEHAAFAGGYGVAACVRIVDDGDGEHIAGVTSEGIVAPTYAATNAWLSDPDASGPFWALVQPLLDRMRL